MKKRGLAGSGLDSRKPRTAELEANEDIIKDLICSPEQNALTSVIKGMVKRKINYTSISTKKSCLFKRMLKHLHGNLEK